MDFVSAHKHINKKIKLKPLLFQYSLYRFIAYSIAHSAASIKVPPGPPAPPLSYATGLESTYSVNLLILKIRLHQTFFTKGQAIVIPDNPGLDAHFFQYGVQVFKPNEEKKQCPTFSAVFLTETGVCSHECANDRESSVARSLVALTRALDVSREVKRTPRNRTRFENVGVACLHSAMTVKAYKSIVQE